MVEQDKKVEIKENKKEEKKVEEKNNDQEIEKTDIKLAKIELGNDLTAKILTTFDDEKNPKRKIKFEFTVHIPTVQEELKMAVREQEILGQAVDNALITIAVRMLATLDIVVDKIKIIDDDGEVNIFKGTFWDMIQRIKQVGKAYKEIVFPVYSKFIEFQSDSETDFDSLKKALAQPGKN